MLRSKPSIMSCLIRVWNFPILPFLVMMYIHATQPAAVPSADPVHAIDQSDTCMTRWISLVISGGTSPPTEYARQEKILNSLLISAGKSSVSNLDPSTVSLLFGENSEAASLFFRCAGTRPQNCQLSSPCLNGGQCLFTESLLLRGGKSFQCQCSNGYIGKFCQTALPHCTDTMCGDDGTCRETSEGYTCICPALKTGRHCESDWFTPAVLSNLTSSIVEIAGQQQMMKQLVANQADSFANQVSDFLSQVANQMNSSLHMKLQSLTTSVAKIERAVNRSVEGIRVLERYHFVPQGSPLDSNKKSSRITLSNNGRTASSQFPRGSVVGTVGYSSGVYQWRIKITELGRGYIGIGVTTLPLDDNNNYNFRSDGTMYAWFSNQYNTGLAASQTVGPARISRWQTGDIVLLTLNCDQLQLHLHLQRTAERKTINMKTAVRGEKLYLYMYLYTNSKSEKLQVDIVS